MIPLRDRVSSKRIPWLMGLLVVINIAVFLLELRRGTQVEVWLYRFGVVPVHWFVGHPSDLLDWPGLFLTLVTSQFLHAGILHLAFNMLYLWIFGDNVEDVLGPWRFSMLYLGSGVVASITQIVIAPQSSIPMVGASGAIAGVLGAYFLIFPTAKIVTLFPIPFFSRIVHVPAFIFLGLWFALQWLYGITTIGRVADVGGVAFWAHCGGFLSGMIGLLLLKPSKAYA